MTRIMSLRSLNLSVKADIDNLITNTETLNGTVKKYEYSIFGEGISPYYSLVYVKFLWRGRGYGNERKK